MNILKFGDRRRTLASIGGPSVAQQQFKDECDINNIMLKYEKSGLLTHVAKYQGDYQDFTVMPDYHTAMNTMMDAQEMFLTIPAKIRAQFDNDPGQFVEFATDPKNLETMRDMGLAPQRPVENAPEPKKASKAAKSDDKSDSAE